MRQEDRDPSNLNRPEWNDLEKNYDLHDIGEKHVRFEMRGLGFEPEAWGIDMRHHDDGLVFDDRMDLKITDAGVDSLVGINEIKTKRRENWYGVINLRHWKHYLEVAQKFDVPVFIYMSKVDDGTSDDAEKGSVDAEQARIVKDTFLPVKPGDEFADARAGAYDLFDSGEEFLDAVAQKHPQVTHTWRAPDGNQVVMLDLETGFGWDEMNYRLVEQEIEWASGTESPTKGRPWRV
jgi:hypothetical protein